MSTEDIFLFCRFLFGVFKCLKIIDLNLGLSTAILGEKAWIKIIAKVKKQTGIFNHFRKRFKVFHNLDHLSSQFKRFKQKDGVWICECLACQSSFLPLISLCFVQSNSSIQQILYWDVDISDRQVTDLICIRTCLLCI